MLAWPWARWWRWAAGATGFHPAGTALWAVLAAGLPLLSLIAWHNYVMLLYLGLLLLLAAEPRERTAPGTGPGRATVPCSP